MDTDSVVVGRRNAPRRPPSSAKLLTGLVPLVVGVTGHRDLRDADLGDLEDAVRRQFRQLEKSHPNRPIVLLSAIAEGADTLVSRIALDIGAGLVVVLPMSRELYERDFKGPAHDEFVSLLDDERVLRRVVVPPVGRAARDLDEESTRALQYALAGAYIAHHSDVLMALWDGLPSDRVGGTAHVVHYRRAGSFDVDAQTSACLADAPSPFGLHDELLEPPDVGPICHIVTPRRGQLRPEDALSVRQLLPYAYSAPEGESDARASSEYRHRLADVEAHIHELNEAAEALEARSRAAIKESAVGLYPDSSSEETVHVLPPALAALRHRFALADALAVRHQRRVDRTLVLLFTLIFAAAASFALFAHGGREGAEAPHAAIGMYGAALAAADAIFLFIRWRRWQDKHQDYRAVAEGLRVQFYWRLAGLEDAASDYYVHHQRDELTWIPRAIRACGLVSPPVHDDRLVSVQELWVSSQAEYYDRARNRAQDNLRWRYAGSGAIGASLGIGAALVYQASADSRWLQVLLVAVGAIFIVHFAVVLLEWWDERRDPIAHTGSNAPFWRIVGAAVASLGTALMLKLPDWVPDGPDWLPVDRAHWWLVAFSVTAVTGALLHAHSQVSAFAEHARRYGRLAVVFRRASARLQTMLDSGELHRGRAMIVQLGKEALADHGDWVVLHRERPIELPEGGG